MYVYIYIYMYTYICICIYIYIYILTERSFDVISLNIKLRNFGAGGDAPGSVRGRVSAESMADAREITYTWKFLIKGNPLIMGICNKGNPLIREILSTCMDEGRPRIYPSYCYYY